MKTFLTSWLVGGWSYPALTAVFSSGLRAALFVLATWLVTLLLRHRSSLLRSWAWRACLVALASTLIWMALPVAFAHWRPAVPVLVDGDSVRTVVNAAQQTSLINRQPSDKKTTAKHAEPRHDDSTFDGDINKEAVAALELLRVDRIASMERYALPVWWVGALSFMLWRIGRAMCGMWWLRRKSQPADASAVALASDAARSLNVRAAPRCRIVKGLRSPVVTGLLKPTIWLPDESSTWSPSKLRSVCLHELAHRRRSDGAWQWFGWLTASAWWWNPFAWFALKRLTAEAELSADELVLNQDVNAPDYAGALVEIAAGGSYAAAHVGVPMLGGSPMEQRIRAILSAAPWRGRFGWKARFVLAGAALCGVVASGIGLVAVTPAMKPLAFAERALVERTLEVMRKRQQQLRVVHLVMEESWKYEGSAADDNAASPMPSKIEAWLDDQGLRHHVRYTPNVSRWTSGAAPFFIEDETAISDGELSWRIRHGGGSHDQDSRPAEASYLLGTMHEREAIQWMDLILRRGIPNPFISEVTEVTNDGRHIARLTKQVGEHGNVSALETWEMDLDAGGMLRRYTRSWPSNPNGVVFEWKATEVAQTSQGIAYPAQYVRSDGDRKRSSTYTFAVKSLEAVEDIPAELLKKSEPPKEPFVSPDGKVSQGPDIELRYVNADDGQPLSKVEVHYELNGAARVKTSTDEQGVIRIPFTKDEVKTLTTWGIKKGFVMQQVKWARYGDPLSLPASYTVKMHPGSPIGGKIMAENGQPVKDAQVSVWHTGGPRQWSVFADINANTNRSAKTNAKGEWKMEGFAKDLTGLTIRVAHSDYEMAQNMDYRIKTGKDYSTLRDGSSIITLRHGCHVEGVVVDARGKPVPDCRITVGVDRRGSYPPTAKTGADGQFWVDGLKTSEAWITFESDHHHPHLQKVWVTNGPADKLRIALLEPRMLRLRMINEAGAPVQDARVIANRWRDKRTIDFEATTDADGRIVWPWAPADEVKYDVLTSDGIELRDLPLTATDEEQTFVLRPAIRFKGTVVDAQTGEPVKIFSIVRGRMFSQKLGWENETRTSQQNGTLDWSGWWLGVPMCLKIEANGYEPFQTAMVVPKLQTETVQVKLKRVAN